MSFSQALFEMKSTILHACTFMVRYMYVHGSLGCITKTKTHLCVRGIGRVYVFQNVEFKIIHNWAWTKSDNCKMHG